MDIEHKTDGTRRTYRYRYSWIVIFLAIAFAALVALDSRQYNRSPSIPADSLVTIFLVVAYVYWKTFEVTLDGLVIHSGSFFYKKSFRISDITVVQYVSKVRHGPYLKVCGKIGVLLEIDSALNGFEDLVTQLKSLAEANGTKFERIKHFGQS